MTVKQTQVIIYSNQRDMRKGIKHMESQGWTVLDVQNVEQGYSGCKTCCLGIIFLPLALLGRKPNKFQVTFQK